MSRRWQSLALFTTLVACRSDAYVAGLFTGTAKFDDETRTAAGGSDAFVWKVPP